MSRLKTCQINKSLNFTLSIDKKIQLEKNLNLKKLWNGSFFIKYCFLSYTNPPPDRVYSQCVILKLLTDLGGNIGCFDKN